MPNGALVYLQFITFPTQLNYSRVLSSCYFARKKSLCLYVCKDKETEIIHDFRKKHPKTCLA
jgi:hypothetical protein